MRNLPGTWDGRSLSAAVLALALVACGNPSQGGVSDAAPPADESPAACDPLAVPYCRGNVLQSCGEDGVAYAVDCSRYGAICQYSDKFGLPTCVSSGMGGQASPNEANAHFLAYPLTFAVPVQNGWQYAHPPNPPGMWHYAVDFGSYDQTSALTKQIKGSDVLSPCSGYAMTSTQYANGTGYGRFVLIRCDQLQASDARHYRVILAHLASTEGTIASFPNRQVGAAKCSDAQTAAQCDAAWTRVEEGTVVGTVGKEDTSWYHLHFEVFVAEYSQKTHFRRDPYDLYKLTTNAVSAEEYYTKVARNGRAVETTTCGRSVHRRSARRSR